MSVSANNTDDFVARRAEVARDLVIHADATYAIDVTTYPMAIGLEVDEALPGSGRLWTLADATGDKTVESFYDGAAWTVDLPRGTCTFLGAFDSVTLAGTVRSQTLAVCLGI